MIPLVVGVAVVVLLVVIMLLFLFVDSARGPRGVGTVNSDSGKSSLNQGKKGRNDEDVGTGKRNTGLGKKESEHTSQPNSERVPIDQPVVQVGSHLGSDTADASSSSAETNADAVSSHDLRDPLESKSDDELPPNQFFTLGAPTSEGIPEGEKADIESSVGDSAETAQFFGVRADAKNIVFVIDKSSSMAARRFETARQELVSSISSLKPQQSFYVVFFDGAPLFQPKDSMQKASQENKEGIRRWIATVSPFGGTEPTAAILRALALEPDAIYVLSDGEFDLSVVTRIRDANQGQEVAIHTIAFQVDASTLRQIAKENRGDYRFVQLRR